MSIAWLGIGTNLGDREANITQALTSLQDRFRLVRCSSIYGSKPAYVEEQPDFLNLACQIETTDSPKRCLEILKSIEVKLGRTPTFPNGPRLIDLDLLFYDDLILELPTLIIPHPRLAERPFVLVPLAEITPDWLHPQYQLSVRDLCQKLGDVSEAIWFHAPIDPDLIQSSSSSEDRDRQLL